jgi:hypothetical protein
VEHEASGYDVLIAMDPDQPRWLDAMNAALADGSALRMASTTDDVRRRIAELRRDS